MYVYARDSDASGIHNKSKIVPFHFLHKCLDLILVQFFQSLGNHRILIVLELFGLEGSEQWQSAKKRRMVCEAWVWKTSSTIVCFRRALVLAL